MLHTSQEMLRRSRLSDAAREFHVVTPATSESSGIWSGKLSRSQDLWVSMGSTQITLTQFQRCKETTGEGWTFQISHQAISMLLIQFCTHDRREHEICKTKSFSKLQSPLQQRIIWRAPWQSIQVNQATFFLFQALQCFLMHYSAYFCAFMSTLRPSSLLLITVNDGSMLELRHLPAMTLVELRPAMTLVELLVALGAPQHWHEVGESNCLRLEKATASVVEHCVFQFESAKLERGSNPGWPSLHISLNKGLCLR